MYRCPHCGKQSISTIAQLCRPFDNCTTCPACGTKLKIRMKLSNFILPIYLFCRSLLGLLLGIHINAGFPAEMAALLMFFFLQIRLIEYKEIPG
jgi:predicted RNA-binding Zn-ribbon protein involved in translation (DUF1610 family)